MRDLPQLRKKPGTALVLSGGATKAFYFHLGVLKTLRPNDVTAIVGSSAGAVLGAFLAYGISIETMLASLAQKQVYLPKTDTWLKILTSTTLFKPNLPDIVRQSLATSLTWVRFLAGLPGLFNKDIVAEAIDAIIASQSHVAGMLDASALEDMFKTVVPSADFAETETDLYVTATGLDHRERLVCNGVYNFEHADSTFTTDVPLHKAVRASTAVPGLFEPVMINGKWYIDGEVRQTLSADIGVRLADRVIISHTYQPLYSANGSVRDMGWLNIIKQATTIVFHERISVWQYLYQQQNPDKEIIWIHPEPDDLEFFLAPEFSFRPEVQKMVIRAGERAALRALEKIEANPV